MRARPEAGAGPGGGLPGPAVSVVMPVGDEDPAAVAEALAAIRAQDHDGEIEIVVANAVAAPRRVRGGGAGRRPRGGEPRLGNASAGRQRGDRGGDRTPSWCAATRAACCRRTTCAGRWRRLRARSAANVARDAARACGRTPFERAVASAMGCWLGSGSARYRRGGAEGPVDTVFLGVFRREAVAVGRRLRRGSGAERRTTS